MTAPGDNALALDSRLQRYHTTADLSLAMT